MVSKLGGRYIAFVVPEAVIGQMSMQKAHVGTETIEGMTVKHFKDVASAKEWLKKQ